MKLVLFFLLALSVVFVSARLESHHQADGMGASSNIRGVPKAETPGQGCQGPRCSPADSKASECIGPRCPKVASGGGSGS